ncbi:MAG: chromosome segregation protein SMC [Sporichthyaceae bacterium]
MHLKSLTLRGFKSFASATTLRFEPGITAVVGPNGSGKSNVVDALAWVMGEQGAKSLRGGKMEDVIFAGTSARPPLGRAEVALTIDNGDGALPIDYTEVTISRTMFRNGGSEYAINGDHCRLLDIQELLSDSGIGREMHVVVGQGQLDAVLSATPEDRRGFIEEAAGVLKHRKRKEKALRKLEAMQANLTRVSDLITELRRQLKPLGKQAEIARRAATVQADLRDARLRLLADDLISLRESLEAEVADETALRARAAEVEHRLGAARRAEDASEAALAEAAPALARAQETWYRLSALRERFRGTAGLAAERARHLAAGAEQSQPGRDPAETEAEAAQVRAQEGELAAGVEAARATLVGAVEARSAAEAALADEERRLSAVIRAAADRREGLARLQGKVGGLRSRAAAAEAELGRLTGALSAARGRAAGAQQEFSALESTAAGLDEGEQGLDYAYEQAARALETARAQLADLADAQRIAERERSALAARKETLELGLARRDGGGILLASEVAGVLGSVAALVTAEHGFETAVAAALAGSADAIAVAGVDSAVAALRHLKAAGAGQAELMIGGADPLTRGPGSPALPAHARYVLELLTSPPALRPALDRLLGAVVVVEDLDAARALVAGHPMLRAVTREGDSLAVDHARGGSASAPSLLEIQAAVDEAAQSLAEADHATERRVHDLEVARRVQEQAQQGAESALARLHESDATMAALAEQLGQLGGTARSAQAEAQRLVEAIAAAEQSRDGDLAGLADLEARLAAAEAEPVETETATGPRENLASAAVTARAAEMEARLALRTGEERARALAGRAEALLRAAEVERAAREHAAQRRLARERAGLVAAAVARGGEYALTALEASLAAAGAERAAADDLRRAHEQELSTARAAVRTLTAELERLTDSVHRDEVARAEHRLRIEDTERRAMEELGVAPDALVAEYGPNQLVAVIIEGTEAGAEPLAGEPIPYVRADQEKRLRAAERALALLGRVNPLALEEFAALEERHQFLSEQLEDLRASRRDLLTVIKEVDERVQAVFADAFADTAREFEGVFARLFPGGEGRLILTDPEDLLTTGIDVAARPPGKKITRLSLLSGGERSLVAVALLVAIFKARPSPFYILDEVEAALDDTNLGRLLVILEELRQSSQLIVITHQKRTMEVADSLYGVSMRGDGVSTVISQRIREEQPV